jgi:hypothetical protein
MMNKVGNIALTRTKKRLFLQTYYSIEIHVVGGCHVCAPYVHNPIGHRYWRDCTPHQRNNFIVKLWDALYRLINVVNVQDLYWNYIHIVWSKTFCSKSQSSTSLNWVKTKCIGLSVLLNGTCTKNYVIKSINLKKVKLNNMCSYN